MKGNLGSKRSKLGPLDTPTIIITVEGKSWDPLNDIIITI